MDRFGSKGEESMKGNEDFWIPVGLSTFILPLRCLTNKGSRPSPSKVLVSVGALDGAPIVGVNLAGLGNEAGLEVNKEEMI
jgi:hypothetical protein